MSGPCRSPPGALARRARGRRAGRRPRRHLEGPGLPFALPDERRLGTPDPLPEAGGRRPRGGEGMPADGDGGEGRPRQRPRARFDRADQVDEQARRHGALAEAGGSGPRGVDGDALRDGRGLDPLARPGVRGEGREVLFEGRQAARRARAQGGKGEADRPPARPRERGKRRRRRARRRHGGSHRFRRPQGRRHLHGGRGPGEPVERRGVDDGGAPTTRRSRTTRRSSSRSGRTRRSSPSRSRRPSPCRDPRPKRSRHEERPGPPRAPPPRPSRAAARRLQAPVPDHLEARRAEGDADADPDSRAGDRGGVQRDRGRARGRRQPDPAG